jgi:hypothetical protein
MGANKKPDACDAGSALGIANHRNNNSTLEPIGAPLGFTLLPEAEAEKVRAQVWLYMVDAKPDCIVELSPGDSDARGVAFVKIQTWPTGEAKTFYAQGWHPTPRIEVMRLWSAFNTIYNSDPTQDDVVRILEDRRQAKSLASDFQECRDTARELRGEMDARIAVCAAHFDLLSDAINWVGPIPASANIFIKTTVKK